MSRRTTSRTASRFEVYQVLCFVALFIAAIVWLLEGLGALKHIPGSWIFILVRDVCTLGAIAIGAYSMVRKMKKGWQIAYWVIIAIAVIGLLFGGLSSGDILTVF